MTIYSILSHDHKKVEKLFEDVEKLKKNIKENGTEKKIKEIFLSIKNELIVHSKSEDIEFYDPLLKKKEMKPLILEAKEEHSMIEKMLEELDEASKINEKWFAKLHELKEIVEHHVNEEENKIFPKAKKILSKEDEKEMEENFIRDKEELNNLEDA